MVGSESHAPGADASAARRATAGATARPRSGRPATRPRPRRRRRRGRRSTTGSSTASTRTPVLPARSTRRPAATAATRRRRTSRTRRGSTPGMRIVESPRLLGLPPHRRPREAGPARRSGPRSRRSPRRSRATGRRAGSWTRRPSAPNTKMPTFFYLENFVDVSGPQARRRAAEDERGRAGSRTTRWSTRSCRTSTTSPGPSTCRAVAGRGDAARGAKLLAERGCFGCHVADPNAQRDLVGTYRQFGPNLVGRRAPRPRATGSTTGSGPEGLEPRHQDAEPAPDRTRTRSTSPSTSSTLKAPAGFDGDGAAEDRREDARRRSPSTSRCPTKTLFDAKAELAKMDLHAKEVYAGENLIAHYGCFACHAIPGFEDAKPIGTELTEEGSKAVHRLDFGFIHLPHTRQDWFRTKLHDAAHLRPRPRARLGREAADAELPVLATRELDQVVTAVLGFQQLNAAPQRRQAALAGGGRDRARAAASSRTTTARAATSSRASAARSGRSSPTPSLAPPIIQGEGAKVQSDWLFALPAGAEDRPDPAVARGPHADLRLHRRGAERPDALLRLARPRRSIRSSIADYATTPPSWAAGKKVFELLKCAQCHPRSIEDMNRPGVDRATLAPNLQMAATRLRHDWINDWIRRPDEWMPGTRMPTNFPKGDDGHRISPLGAACSTRRASRPTARSSRGILGGDEQAEAVPVEPRGRHAGPAATTSGRSASTAARRRSRRRRRRRAPRRRPARFGAGPARRARRPAAPATEAGRAAPRPRRRPLLREPGTLARRGRAVPVADAGDGRSGRKY